MTFWKQKLMTLVIGACLLLFFIPIKARAEGQTIYTQYTGGGSTGSGTQADPYQDLTNALDAARAGDTIVVLSGGGYAADTNDGLPLVIDKAVTIQGEADASGNYASLNVRRAGIVLSADVTFQDLNFNFSNSLHNAVFANGHTLTLKNTSRVSGTRTVHLFAGSLFVNDVQQGSPGNAGKIVIHGQKAQFGNIYAGSMDGSIAADQGYTAEIIIHGTTSMSLGTIYACGAATGVYNPEDLFGNTEPEAPKPSASLYPVAALDVGTVAVSLTDATLTEVNGATGGDFNASVTVSTANPKENLSLENLYLLTVKTGKLKPAALNAGVHVSIESGGILDLSGVMEDSAFTIGAFQGGGTLQLGYSDTLTVSGAVTGTTAFETVSSAVLTGSGPVEKGHTYIKTPADTAQDAFSFIPYALQENLILENQEGNWVIAESGSATQEAGLTSFFIDRTSWTVRGDEIGEADGPFLPVVCEFTEDSQEDLGCVPLSYTLKYGSQEYKAVQQTDAYGYYYGEISILNLRFVPMEKDIWMYCIDADEKISTGTFTLTITAPLSGGEAVEQTVALTISDSQTEMEAVDPPIISLIDSKTVKITCDTQDAQIYYTLGGGMPSSESTLYSEPFQPGESTSVAAIAVKAGMVDSEIIVMQIVKGPHLSVTDRAEKAADSVALRPGPAGTEKASDVKEKPEGISVHKSAESDKTDVAEIFVNRTDAGTAASGADKADDKDNKELAAAAAADGSGHTAAADGSGYEAIFWGLALLPVMYFIFLVCHSTKKSNF